MDRTLKKRISNETKSLDFKMFKVQIKINNAKYKKKDEKYVLIFKNALALIKFLIFSNIVLIENP